MKKDDILLYVILGLLVIVTLATVFRKTKTSAGTTQLTAFGAKIYETKPKTETTK